MDINKFMKLSKLPIKIIQLLNRDGVYTGLTLKFQSTSTFSYKN